MPETTCEHGQEIHLRIPAGMTDEFGRALFDEVCRLADQSAPPGHRLTVSMTRNAGDPTGPFMYLTPRVEEEGEEKDD